MRQKIVQNQEMQILEEIIDNASGLPIECQDLLLLLSKGMAYTRECIIKEQDTSDSSLATQPQQTA